VIVAAESVPKGSRGLPKCPRHLKGRARSALSFLKAELEAMDLDCRPDALSLEGGCLAYQAAIEAEEVLATEGLRLKSQLCARVLWWARRGAATQPIVCEMRHGPGFSLSAIVLVYRPKHSSVNECNGDFSAT